MIGEIPDVVVQRLPRYVRELRLLSDEGVEVVSSQELGTRLLVTPAQIRKDLNYFGRFGKQGRGYNVRHLLEDLRDILGLGREWKAVLVGMGRLGRAVISYPGFAPEGFRIVGAFDVSLEMVGQKVAGVDIRHLETMTFHLRNLQRGKQTTAKRS
jgi:redox-sensing transcriptional repressor